MDEEGVCIQFFRAIEDGPEPTDPTPTTVNLIPDQRKCTTERYYMRDGFVLFESDRSGLSLVISPELDADEKDMCETLFGPVT